MASFWAFLQDETNRAILGWVGGGIIVVVGALWTAFKFYAKNEDEKSMPSLIVTADRGGLAAGGDIRNNTITREADTPKAKHKQRTKPTGGTTARII
jgi:hypothetical protein